MHAIPSRTQLEIAKTLTGHSESDPVQLTYAAVFTAVKMQAVEAKSLMDGCITQELLAALTWDRTIVVPDTAWLAAIADDPLPHHALRQLASLPRQTNYLLLEQQSVADPSAFINGAWLIRNVDIDTNEPMVLLLLDLVVAGQPVRDVLMEFTLEESLEAAIEVQIEKIAREQQWDSMPGALAQRESMRQYMLTARPVLAALYDTFVRQGARVEGARASATRDELGFALVERAPQPSIAVPRMAAGMYH